MKTPFLIFAAVVASRFAAQAVDVLAGPVVNTANGHSYYLLTPSGWNAAEAKAQELGGHFATVRDQAENDLLLTNFGFYSGTARFLWLGLTDYRQEGVFRWRWQSGEPLAYTNWAPGEPNNAGGQENWTALIGPSGHNGTGLSGQWNDLVESVADPVQGAVEVSTVIPLLDTMAHHAIEMEWVSQAGKCFQIQSRAALNGSWSNDGEVIPGS